jgi:hypothetical protein
MEALTTVGWDTTMRTTANGRDNEPQGQQTTGNEWEGTANNMERRMTRMTNSENGEQQGRRTVETVNGRD